MKIPSLSSGYESEIQNAGYVILPGMVFQIRSHFARSWNTLAAEDTLACLPPRASIGTEIISLGCIWSAAETFKEDTQEFLTRTAVS
jgi:hypothetical protein